MMDIRNKMTEIYYPQWEVLTSKPNRFNGVLKDHSVADGIDEWYEVERPERIYEKIIQYKCICSTDIEKLFYIKNRLNGNTLIIGSECINKFGSDEMIRIHKIKVKSATYTGNKRMCQSCSNFRISQNAPYYVTQCKSCRTSEAIRVSPEVYGKAADNRQCIECNKYNIPHYHDSWKIKCVACYAIADTLENNRQCTTCNKYNIPLSSDTRKTRCIICCIGDTIKLISMRNVATDTVNVSGDNFQCNVCNQYNIPSSSNVQGGKCVICCDGDIVKSLSIYNQEADNRQCTVCNKYNISLSSETWKVKCLPCWKSER